MERISLIDGKEILGNDFIGPNELNAICGLMGLKKIDFSSLPELVLTKTELRSIKENNSILFAVNNKMESGEQLSIASLRNSLGLDSIEKVGFYNQDWYLKEAFYAKEFEAPFWALLPKNIPSVSRAKIPSNSDPSVTLPSALLVSYLFFIYYFHTKGTLLWKNDYIWCSDVDHNGDMVYVGRYEDPAGINQNGFSIHRHLKISEAYGFLNVKIY